MHLDENHYEYFISIGSNIDNAPHILSETFILLKEKFEDIIFSEVITTQGLGMEINCIFHNAVARIKTTIAPHRLKLILKEIEKNQGRIPHSDIVALDLDIILINKEVVHQDYSERRFIRDLIKSVENKI